MSPTWNTSATNSTGLYSNEELLWNQDSDDFLFGEDDDFISSSLSATALQRKAEDPEVIERLGSLMAILGPRYKTVSRDALWERARVGETTPLQRQLACIGETKRSGDGNKKKAAAARLARQ